MAQTEITTDGMEVAGTTIIPQAETISVSLSKNDNRGKQGVRGDFALWTLTGTPHQIALQLIQHGYIEGKSIAPYSLKDYSARKPGGKVNRFSDNWHATRLVVLDFDDLPAGTTIQDIIADCERPEFIACAKPSSSYKPDKPKYHVFMLVSHDLETIEGHQNIYTYVFSLFGTFTADIAFFKKPIQAVGGTVFTNIDHKPALNDGLCYVNPAPAVIVVWQAVRHVWAKQGGLASDKESKAGKGDTGGLLLTAGQGAANPDPITNHMTPARVLAAVRAVFSALGRVDYDTWLSATLAAYAATNGSVDGLQAVIDSYDSWQGNEQREFAAWWAGHTPRTGDNAITGATLIYMAQGAGFKLTHAERQHMPKRRAAYVPVFDRPQPDTIINQARLKPDVIPDGARVVLLESPLGTGKTHIIESCNMTFTAVSPLRVLESATFNRFSGKVDGVMSYRDDMLQGGKYPHDTPVTTCFKSFAAGEGDVTDKVIFIDEISSTIAQLNSPVFGYSEAWLAVGHLLDVMREAKRVVLMDAHIDPAVFAMLAQFGIEYHYIKNEYRPDTQIPLTVQRTVTDKGAISHTARAYVDVLKDVKDGARVAIAMSSVAAAEALQITAAKEGIDTLLITGNTDNADMSAIAIGNAVNEGKLVIYTYAMSSGVSIENTTLDRLYVVWARHMDTPAVLQMMARFRAVRAVTIDLQFDHDIMLSHVTSPAALIEAIQDRARASFDSVAQYKQAIAGGFNIPYSKDAHSLDSLLTYVVASRNASLNALWPHFLELEGGRYDIQPIEIVNEHTGAKQALTAARDEIKAAKKEAVLAHVANEQPLNSHEYEALQRKAQYEALTETERAAITRYAIEDTTGQQVTGPLYDRYHKPAQRAALRFAHDALHVPIDSIAHRLAAELNGRYDDTSGATISTGVSNILNRVAGFKAMYDILKEHTRDNPLSHNDLEARVNVWLREHNAYFAGERVPTTPQGIARKVLGAGGFRIDSSRIKVAGGKEPVYHIDAAVWAQQHKDIQARQEAIQARQELLTQFDNVPRYGGATATQTIANYAPRLADIQQGQGDIRYSAPPVKSELIMLLSEI